MLPAPLNHLKDQKSHVLRMADTMGMSVKSQFKYCKIYFTLTFSTTIASCLNIGMEMLLRKFILMSVETKIDIPHQDTRTRKILGENQKV